MADSTGCLWKCGCTWYVTLSYLFVKSLYVAVALGQWYFLGKFLLRDSESDKFWALQVRVFHTPCDTLHLQLFEDLLNGRWMSESPMFPRVTWCDIVTGRVGQPFRTTIQCTLMINQFNEKVYQFLLFWLPFVALITILDILWTIILILPYVRTQAG